MTDFSEADLKRFYDSYMAARGKLEALAAAYAGKAFTDERARGFARHGVPQRLELSREWAMDDVPDVALPRVVGPFPGKARESRKCTNHTSGMDMSGQTLT